MKINIKLLFFGLILALSSHPAYAADPLATAQAAYRQITVTGFTRARASMELATEVPGKIEHVYADIGDAIPGDGKFACIDDTFVAIDIKSAENDIARHGTLSISIFIKNRSPGISNWLKKSAAVSLLDDLERQLGNSQRLLQSDKLRKQRLRETRRRHCVESPSGWKVVERYIEPGQWVDTGMPVARVSDYSSLLVPFALSEKQLAALQQQRGNLKVFLPDFDRMVPAAIEHISPAFDDQSRKLRIDLLVNEGLPQHRGGLRVDLTLKLMDEPGILLIAKGALDKRFEEIWLERKDGKNIRVSLLGYNNAGMARIQTSQIQAGDQFKILHP